MGLALGRKPLRAKPVARLDKNRALFRRPFMAWGEAVGAKILAPRPSGERSHGNRRIGWAKDGGADFCNSFPFQFGKKGKRSDIGGLSLIRRHAERGVTLHMFDGPEPFLMGELDILDRDVILKI